MPYPARMLIGYPVAGLLGVILVTNVQVAGVDDRPAYVLGSIAAFVVGATVGGSTARTVQRSGARSVPASVALSAGVFGVSCSLLLQNRVAPEVLLWMCGVGMIGMAVGFFGAAITGQVFGRNGDGEP